MELDLSIAERLGWTEFKPHPIVAWPYGKPAIDNPAREPLPLYSQDLNAAVTLPLTDDYYDWGFHVEGPFPYWQAWITERESEELDTNPERADTPALAVARCWLSWHDAQP